MESPSVQVEAAPQSTGVGDVLGAVVAILGILGVACYFGYKFLIWFTIALAAFLATPITFMANELNINPSYIYFTMTGVTCFQLLWWRIFWRPRENQTRFYNCFDVAIVMWICLEISMICMKVSG